MTNGRFLKAIWGRSDDRTKAERAWERRNFARHYIDPVASIRRNTLATYRATMTEYARGTPVPGCPLLKSLLTVAARHRWDRGDGVFGPLPRTHAAERLFSRSYAIALSSKLQPPRKRRNIPLEKVDTRAMAFRPNLISSSPPAPR
nr:hypothetical protein CFP56_16523 [Quercus suber]